MNIIQASEVVTQIPLHTLRETSDQSVESKLGASQTYEPHSGGFLNGGKLAWRAFGPTVEVFNPKLGIRHAAWTFSPIVHNSVVTVTSVCGIGVGNITHVAIGVDLGPQSKPQGMVGILSLRRSRLIRLFSLPNKVKNICMVSGGEKFIDPTTLASELRCCAGLLAVATSCAELYLIDLCMDSGHDEITSDENCPALFSDIIIPDPDPEKNRQTTLSKKRHPILCLSDNFSKDVDNFSLLGPNKNILYEAPKDSVEVTSLIYVPQLASLVVGYSFGSFQIINLSNITVDCASPFEEDVAPVVAVSYQEPEDDPRSFVYLWVSRSWVDADYEGTSPAVADSCCFSLYAMNYEKKEWIEGHGLWHQSLLAMSARFDFDAFGGVVGRVVPARQSIILSTFTVREATTYGDLCPVGAPISLASTDEETDPVPDLSLTFFCWQSTFLLEGKLTTYRYVAVFDINQWYQAQMPGQLRLNSQELCPYMSFCVLTDVPKCTAEFILGTFPSRGSWSRYLSQGSTEKDWYPSSLSFDLQLITSDCLITVHCPSIQEKAIVSLVEQGPGAIVEPEEAHATCRSAGLLTSATRPSNPTLEHIVQREDLLTVALEHQLVSFIMNCVTEFSEGKFSNVGCTLTLLSDWAWNQVYSVKSSYDTLCLPLFDTNLPLNNSSLVSLHHFLINLNHLHSIISAIKSATASVTDTHPKELQGRVDVVELLQLHLRACLWFHQSGLLPHISARTQEAGKDIVVPYPANILHEVYHKRHMELRKSKPSGKLNEILLVETLFNECGDALNDIWKKDVTNGIYPPPSLHSLLTIYLLPQIPVVTKHRIVQYLFLDLASLLSDNYGSVVDELVKFPASFSLSPSIIKLTQAFWLIDHKDFQEGLGVLLHPLVDPQDITSQQHQAIVRALLYQNESKKAITYSELREPAHLKTEDIQFHLSLLLANGKIRQAFHHQQTRGDAQTRNELLQFLFVGCEELGQLECITHLPLKSAEQEKFMQYLSHSQDSTAKDIMFTFSLQKSRFCGMTGFVTETDNSKVEKTRDALMQGFLTHLPHTNTSTNDSKKQPIPYKKPQPLSAFVRQTGMSSSPLRQTSPDLTNRFLPACTPFRSRTQRRHQWRKEKSPQPATHEERSHIVVPTMKETPRLSRVESNVSRLQFGDMFDEIDFDVSIEETNSDVVNQLEQMIRKSYNVCEIPAEDQIHNKSLTGKISADVLSLLRTPPPALKKFNVSLVSESFSDTPQSILKIRNRCQLSTSSPLTKPRSLESLIKQSSVKGSERSFSSQSAWTPKQLRFHLPSGNSPNLTFSSEKAKELSEPKMTPSSRKAIHHLNFEEQETMKDNDDSRTSESTSSEADSPVPSTPPIISVTDEELSDNEELYEGTEVHKIHCSSHESSKVSDTSFLSDESFHSVVDQSEEVYVDEVTTQLAQSSRTFNKSCYERSIIDLSQAQSPGSEACRTQPSLDINATDIPDTAELPLSEDVLHDETINPDLILEFSDSESDTEETSFKFAEPTVQADISIEDVSRSPSPQPVTSLEPEPLRSPSPQTVTSLEPEPLRIPSPKTVTSLEPEPLHVQEIQDVPIHSHDICPPNNITDMARDPSPVRDNVNITSSSPSQYILYFSDSEDEKSESPKTTAAELTQTSRENVEEKLNSPKIVAETLADVTQNLQAETKETVLSDIPHENVDRKNVVEESKNTVIESSIRPDEITPPRRGRSKTPEVNSVLRRSRRVSTATPNKALPVLVTPSRRKRKASEVSIDEPSEEKPSENKRSRRSVSRDTVEPCVTDSTESTTIAHNLTTDDEPVEKDQEELLQNSVIDQTKARNTRKSCSVEPTELPATPTRRSRRSCSVEPTVKTPPRTTRRSSVIEPDTPSRKTRRSSLVEEAMPLVAESPELPTKARKASNTPSKSSTAKQLNIPKEAFITMPPVATPKLKMVDPVTPSTPKRGRRVSELMETPTRKSSRGKAKQEPSTPTRSSELQDLPVTPKRTPGRKSTRKSVAVPADSHLATIEEALELDPIDESTAEPKAATTTKSSNNISTQATDGSEKDKKTTAVGVLSPELEYKLIDVPESGAANVVLARLPKRKRSTKSFSLRKIRIPDDDSHTEDEEESASKNRRTKSTTESKDQFKISEKAATSQACIKFSEEDTPVQFAAPQPKRITRSKVSKKK